MCGRARCSLAREAIITAAGVHIQKWRDEAHYRPSYNCSPGSWIPVIKLGSDGTRELQTMKWGLVPGFTRLGLGERPDHYRMFNARSERLMQSPIFSRLLPGKRCIVLLDGFYEWHNNGGGASRKQPYHISTVDGSQQPAMYLAGLYDVSQDSTGEHLHTFTIITVDSSESLAWLHDRMPVILTSQEDVSLWLGERSMEDFKATVLLNIQDDPVKEAVRGEGCDGGTAAARDVPQSPVPRSTTVPAEALGDKSGPNSITPSSRSMAAMHLYTGSSNIKAACSAKSLHEDTPNTEEILDANDGGDAVVRSYENDGDDSGDDGGREGGPGAGLADEDQLLQRKVGGCHGEHKAAARRGQGGRGKADRVYCESLVEQICRPYGGPLLRWYPVTPDMSKPTYDKPDCCKDVRTKKGSIASFFKPAAKGAGGSAAASGMTSSLASLPSIKKEQPSSIEHHKPLHGSAGMVVKKEGKVTEVREPDAASMAGATMAHNSDDCPGADGSVSGKSARGMKRQAESEARGGDAAARRKG